MLGFKISSEGGAGCGCDGVYRITPIAPIDPDITRGSVYMLQSRGKESMFSSGYPIEILTGRISDTVDH